MLCKAQRLFNAMSRLGKRVNAMHESCHFKIKSVRKEWPWEGEETVAWTTGDVFRNEPVKLWISGGTSLTPKDACEFARWILDTFEEDPGDGE